MAAAAPAATAPAAAATAPAAKLENPKSARGPHKEEPPKTSAEEDAAFLKTVVEACHTSTVNRACQALKWHVDSGALVTEACRALAALAQDNAKKQTLIQQKGGLTFLLAAMKKHATDVKIQEDCCSALISICDQNDSNANAVAKPAIPVLMEQLKANEKTTEYVAVGVHALDIVCAAASGRKEAALKGVPQLVIELMKKHTTSARIQERGSGVLRHIASDATGKKLIAENGGRAFLEGLKKLFPNSSVLDENVSEAIKRLDAKESEQPTTKTTPALSTAAPAAPPKEKTSVILTQSPISPAAPSAAASTAPAEKH